MKKLLLALLLSAFNNQANAGEATFPACFMIVSGSQEGYQVEFEHENAHCWGWDHGPEYTYTNIHPPKMFSIEVLGVYPNIVFPYGVRVSKQQAYAACKGHSACMREGQLP